GTPKAAVVAHDIGLMVAYAYAAQFPDEVERLALMDAFLPGVEGWEAIYNHPAIWHFRFNGPTPEALVKGRERIYFEHFWNDFAADKTHSIPEADGQAYTAAYARPGRMRSAWAYFSHGPLLLIVGGQPRSTAVTTTMPQMRLTPEEVRARQTGSERISSSGLAGVSTQILFGDPSKRGFYTIVLFVPAHTTIPAHSHLDDRMATVVSGTGQFGNRDPFDERALKNLPDGTGSAEPGRGNHFARTAHEPVLVEIAGAGATDTKYVNPSDAPKVQNR